MNETTLRQLRILVERAVRPVRASVCRKRQMREELLAHVTAVFEEEAGRLANEQAALERTAQRFGNPAELTGHLQETVPAFDAFDRLVEDFADRVPYQPGESALRRAVRYAVISEAAAFLLLFVSLLLVRCVVGELPTDALLQTCPALLISGYLGFALGLLESCIRRLLGEQTRSSWLLFAVVVLGSAIVSVNLGFLAYGVSVKTGVWVFLFTVGFPTVSAWRLAHALAARQRDHEDWASLSI